MGQTLTNGIYLPDEGERNSYSGLEANWRTLDALILTINGKAAPNVANTWTAVQTFTAGIAGDLTGNVTGNVTGDLTGKASRATADEDGTNIKTGYVNVAGTQTITGDKGWTGTNRFALSLYQKGFSSRTSAPASNEFGQLAITDINNIPLISLNYANRTTGARDFTFRVADNAGNFNGAGVFKDASNNYSFCSLDSNNPIPLGTSTNQWSSVYAQSYYYNGTAWGLDKANVWTQSQTLKNTEYQIGEIPSAAKARYITFTDKNNVNIGWVQRRIESSGDSSIELFVYNKFTNSQPDTAGTLDYAMLKVGLKSDQTHFCEITGDAYPRNNNTYNLGTSTNKWKTLNGINPGALSLPNSPGGTGTVNINYIDLSGDITIRDASGVNSYTAICDGWIAINSFATWIQIADDTTLVCVTGAIGADGFSQCYLPVRKNDSIRIIINQTNTNFQSFKLIPCQGNV